MWKNEIKKYNYRFGKSSFWGSMHNVPNELNTIVAEIAGMTEEERNREDVQKDIAYIKELCEFQINKLQGYLDTVNKL